MKTDDRFGAIVLASLIPTGPSYLYLKHDQVVTGYPRLNPVVRIFGRSKSRHTLITFSSVVATCPGNERARRRVEAGTPVSVYLAELVGAERCALDRRVGRTVRGNREFRIVRLS